MYQLVALSLLVAVRPPFASAQIKGIYSYGLFYIVFHGALECSVLGYSIANGGRQKTRQSRRGQGVYQPGVTL